MVINIVLLTRFTLIIARKCTKKQWERLVPFPKAEEKILWKRVAKKMGLWYNSRTVADGIITSRFQVASQENEEKRPTPIWFPDGAAFQLR
jgi:hypothetical protein